MSVWTVSFRITLSFCALNLSDFSEIFVGKEGMMLTHYDTNFENSFLNVHFLKKIHVSH